MGSVREISGHVHSFAQQLKERHEGDSLQRQRTIPRRQEEFVHLLRPVGSCEGKAGFDEERARWTQEAQETREFALFSGETQTDPLELFLYQCVEHEALELPTCGCVRELQGVRSV